jgi:hypothetical protein
VSEPSDEPPVEILDVGGRRPDATQAPPDLPPLHIDPDQPPTEQTESSIPPWRQIAAVVTALAVGAAAGAYVWNAREDAANLAAAAQEAVLIAGQVEGGSSTDVGTQRFRVAVLNAGPRDVEVLSAVPDGWAAVEEETFPPQVATVDEWTSVQMAAEPDCDAPVPRGLRLRVRTDAGETDVTVPLPPGDDAIGAVHQNLCADAFLPYGASVEDVRTASESPTELVMELAMRSYDLSLDFDLVDVTATAEGFEAVASNLPVPFRSGNQSTSPLILVWRVTRCDQTINLGDVELSLRYAPTGSGATDHIDGYALSGEVVATLARFGAAQCPS